MRTLLIHWFLLAIALAVSTHFVPGVHVDTIQALVIASAAVGLTNALVRPILVLLSLPLTFLTLGLFYLVVNGVSFGLAAWLVDGFRVDANGPATKGALCTSVVSWVLGWFVDDEDERDEKRRKRAKRRD